MHIYEEIPTIAFPKRVDPGPWLQLIYLVWWGPQLISHIKSFACFYYIAISYT